MIWTAEMDDFMRGFVPGHQEREIAAAFAERFGVELSRAQLRNRKSRLGLKSGTHGGRFETGRVPHTTGRRAGEWASADGRARMARTQFKPGNVPANARRTPVGSERVTKDGYVQVKVAERPRLHGGRPSNDNWVMKHVLEWERANGRPVPKGCCVLFADRDKRNFDPANLVLATRGQMGVINKMGLRYSDARTLRACLSIADLKMAQTRAVLREPRACRDCGAEFKPRYDRQARCEACIAARKRKRKP